MTADATTTSTIDRRISQLADLAWDRRVRLVVLGASGLVMLGLLLFVGRWLVFWIDEWDFIFDRQTGTLRSVLAPYLDTLLATPSLLYQALLAAFGLTYLPFLLVTWAAHFVCVALLYHVVARRSGPLLGAMAALSLLFLGSAYEVLLQPFQVQYLFAAAGGLLALDRLLVVEDQPGRSHRARDLSIAAIALLFAVASSSLGPIMVGLVVVWAVLRRDWPALASVVPATVAYAAWYLTWGRESGALAGPPLDVLGGVAALFYGLGAAVCGVLGLPPERFAPVGLVVAIVAVVALVAARIRPAPLAVAGLLALVAEYGLSALLRGSLGIEHAARSGYLYPAAIFLWLTISGVLGRRLDEPAWRGRGRLTIVPLLITLLIVPMVVGNMRQFVGAARGSRDLRATELAELRLIEALRGRPDLTLDTSPDPSFIPQVTAGEYLAAIDRFGAPDLGWDWSTAVDEARVNAAAVRLLATGFAVDPPTAGHATAPVIAPTDLVGATATAGDPGCLAIRPTGGNVSATWDPGGDAIVVRDLSAGDPMITVGILGAPSAALAPPVEAALVAGRAILLPHPPPGEPWRVTLVTDAASPFEICALSPA